MAYLLDANVFIEAKSRYYGFDFCPAFWEWLIVKNAQGELFSIEKVGDEIKAGNDDLAKWATERNGDFFLAPSFGVPPALERVSDWVTKQKSPSYETAAIRTFLQGADYYLIAHALLGGYEVVTHEVPSDSRKRIKIPNVCSGLGVKCVMPFEMLRREQARFVLEASCAST